MHGKPLLEYKTRLNARQATVQRYENFDQIISVVRLAVAGLFIVLAWLAWQMDVVPAWILALPVAVFAGLVICHERVSRGRTRAQRAVRFYEEGIARIEDRWMGRGRSEFTSGGDSHLYAADFDLFGEGSLFELLCTARTRSGEETLAAWLCLPAEKDEILARQEAIGELRESVDLREDFAVLGQEVRSSIRPQLTRWSTAPPVLKSRAARIAALCLAVLNAATVAYVLAGGAALPMLAVLAVSIAFARILRGRVLLVLDEAQEPARELKILALALARLEREEFRSPKLKAVRAALQTAHRPASQQIGQFLRLVGLADSQRNQFFRPISYFLMWATQVAHAIEAWRQRHGHQVPQWLGAVGEFEALCALAGFSYEHPDDPFPEVHETGPLFDGQELRHPLMPAAQCVANSVRFDEQLHLLVVSGSNMSGKSTLLRTVGVNVVLALAGAPVRARHLRISTMNVGATLRIQDSLQAGKSRFYAEIQRLRQIMDLTAGPLPVLFLLDEILHGTNSHDRAIGAEAVVRGLLNRGAIGLVTTHDLALARVAEALAPRAANVHFEDHMEDGRMTFDYVLRNGVVKKSNALELMRAVGLDV